MTWLIVVVKLFIDGELVECTGNKAQPFTLNTTTKELTIHCTDELFSDGFEN